MIEGAFHHIGLATWNLDAETRCFLALGYAQESPDFEDPIQGIRGRFLSGPGPRMELVSPTGAGGVLEPWLERGAKMYHLAFEVSSLQDRLAGLCAAGGRVVTEPVPAVAFGGRRIAFVVLPNMLLVELIEAA